MKRENYKPMSADELRSKAQERLKKNPGTEDIAKTNDELNRIVQELQIHQIELEMMNEELQQSRDEVERGLEQYTELYDYAPVGFFTLEQDGKINNANLTGAKMLGIDRSKLMQRRFGLFVSEETRPVFNELLKKVFENNVKESCEVLLISDNKQLNADIKVTARGGETECKIAVIDITERKHAEQIIQQQNIQLKELNATKNKFFSIIAHDLKGPFQGFIGLTSTMAENSANLTTEDIELYSKEMNLTAKNLFKLLTNLLKWAQMQQGTINFSPKVLDLAPLVSQSILSLLKSAEQKKIIIQNEVPPEFNIFADQDMLSNVLRNLISNSVKFTNENGKIIITAKQSGNEMILVSITDNGVGMSENVVNKLFKIEEKISSKGTAGELGTGLGLLLCKEFIEKHGGKIWAESTEDAGSSFYFTLPVKNYYEVK
ncbi:MAG: PAS domain-containing sensor histidine kinase [Bacteroidota bacterium]|nr:PAS domain-containing sensor histidine kinase [Bacteroidota bacterium]